MAIRWRSLLVAPEVRIVADRAVRDDPARREADLDVSGLLCGL